MKTLTELTSARYELLTSQHELSGVTFRTLSAMLDDAIGYKAPAPLYDFLEGIPTKPEPIAPLPPAKSKRAGFKIALCLGHSRPGDSGAGSLAGFSEWSFYNTYIVEAVAAGLRWLGYEVLIIDEYVGNSYGTAMRWLANKVALEECDLAYEFHFNAASPAAEGFENLFWHKSRVSRPVAEAVQAVQAAEFPESKDRGVEPLGDQAHERGTLFCSLLHCPSVILEPFFGTSETECERYMSEEGRERLIEMFIPALDAGALQLLES